jgi:two-component system CheB/CheR fusion protein
MIDALPMGMLVLDTELKVRSANRTLYQLLEIDPKHVVGESLEHLAGGYWNEAGDLLERLQSVLKDGDAMREVRVRTKFPRVGNKDLAVTAQRVSGAVELLLLTIDDTH